MEEEKQEQLHQHHHEEQELVSSKNQDIQPVVTNKEKLTTTKQIVYMVLIVWVGSLIFSAGSWVFRGTHPTGLMNSVNTVAVPTILSYAVKSGFEFVTKAKNGLFTTETK